MPYLRVWDIEPALLCRNHLLGEHREIHAVWNVHTLRRKGYSRHPEILRWKGKLAALYLRHEALAGEMGARGYCHRSPLDRKLARGCEVQDEYVDTPEAQLEILRSKGCSCDV